MKGRVGLINDITDVFVGVMHYPDRKRPALVVQRGNCAVVIGYLKDDVCVECFKTALADVLNQPPKEE